jgi:hypothetical protein
MVRFLYITFFFSNRHSIRENKLSPHFVTLFVIHPAHVLKFGPLPAKAHSYTLVYQKAQYFLNSGCIQRES